MDSTPPNAMIAGVCFLVLLVVVALWTMRGQYSWSLQTMPVLCPVKIAGSSFASYQHKIKQQPVRPDGIVLTVPDVFQAEVGLEWSIVFHLFIDNVANSTSFLSASTEDTLGKDRRALHSFDQYRDPYRNGLASLLTLNEDEFSVAFDAFRDTMVVRIRGSNGFQEFSITSKIKTQKWTMVCISLRNRVMDIFVDNDLVQSFTLSNVPHLSIAQPQWSLFQGMQPFDGIISNVRLFNFPLDLRQVQSLRRHEGNVSSSMWWWTYVPPGPVMNLFS